MSAYRRARLGLVIGFALSATGAVCAADRPAPEWIAKAEAACIETFDDARCQDDAYLIAEARTLATRDVARRAAVRGNQQERRAARELLTSSPAICATQLRHYCRTQGGCSRNALSLCDTVAAQRQQCETQATRFCRQHGLRNCREMVERQCPDQATGVDDILARYPGLSATQQSRLRQLAHQLDSGDTSQLSTALRKLLNLLGLG